MSLDIPPLRVAHISDLHFGTISWSPFQFCSKRWLGNLNLLLTRQWSHFPDRVATLLGLFKREKVTHVLVSGDLSTTSLGQEFTIAKELIDFFQKEGIEMLCIPGNHDCYTQGSAKTKRFYDYFPETFGQKKWNLREHRIACHSLRANWWAIGIDQAIATPYYSSQGEFSQKTEEHLRDLLSEIPSDDSILLFGHFPVFNNDPPMKGLIGSDRLLALFEEFPNIRFYLHGHSHRHSVVDLRSSNLPILLDSGSASHHREGTCHLLSLDESLASLTCFKYAHLEPSKDKWKVFKEEKFLWKSHELV